MKKKEDEYKSAFSKKIRIKKKQLEWIRENKNTRTMAGFLDKIINQYKNEYKDRHQQIQKENLKT